MFSRRRYSEPGRFRSGGRICEMRKSGINNSHLKSVTEAGEQPHSHNPRKQPKNPALTGWGDTFRERRSLRRHLSATSISATQLLYMDFQRFMPKVVHGVGHGFIHHRKTSNHALFPPTIRRCASGCRAAPPEAPRSRATMSEWLPHCGDNIRAHAGISHF